MGRNKAAEMLFTCDHVTGEEAFRIGLANKVVPADELMTAAGELADRIKSKSPLVLKYSRQALRKDEFSAEKVEWVNNVRRELDKTEDKKEAFTAVLEKRAPVFKGK